MTQQPTNQGNTSRPAQRKIIRAASKAARTEVKTLVTQAQNRQLKAAARQAGKRLMQRALEDDAGRDSPYLRCLLDPGAYGPCSYPDCFGGKVTLGKFTISKTVKVDSNGNFAVWASPTLNNTLMYPPTSAGFAATWGINQSFNQNNDDLDHPRVTIPAFGNWNYLQVPNGPSFSGTDGKEFKLNVKEATKILLPPGYSGATVNIVAAGTSAYNGTPLLWQSRLPGGVTTAITPGTPVAIPIGQEWFQLQVSRSGGGSKDYLRQIAVELSMTVAANNGPWEYLNIPDYDLLVGDDGDVVDGGGASAVTFTTPLYTEYRPVAMSALCSFVGNELYNGGTIAAKYLAGGDTPTRLNYPTYEELSQVPDTFTGPLKTGAYCFWRPTDPEDVKFKEPAFDNFAGGLPSIYIAGKATDPTNTQIRVLITLCVEAKTTRQILPTENSVIEPSMIEAADKALQNMPYCMENPLHLEKIAEFLRGVVKKGEQLWARYEKPIMATAGAAAKIAPLFLAA